MPKKDSPDFTIGMACYDNYIEVFFTIQSLRFHHAEVMDRFEIVLVDNNPGSIDGVECRKFIEGRVGNGRYIPFPRPKGSCPPRGHLFEVARGRFVACIDSHVLFETGSLAKLVEYFDAHPESDDFLHGPLLSNYGPHRLEATEMVPQWRSEMFGTWKVDPRGKDRDSEPFEIEQHGLGFFAARRESWLGFHPGFVGFSGGEGYIHEKYRQDGRKIWCLPGVRWNHLFNRPYGIPHRPQVHDKIKNHARGWMELGIDLATRDGKKTDDPLASQATHYVGGGRMSAKAFEQLIAEAGFPNYRVSSRSKTRACVVGPLSFGSYRMRGRPIVEAFGFREYNSRAKIRLNGRDTFDVALVVKAGVPPVIRKAAKRLIWEPLDLWFEHREQAKQSPEEWIRKQHAANKFDEIIVSTIPMMEAADKIPGLVVHFIPHHADPRVGNDGTAWRNPSGPIVYSGHSYFVKGFEDSIRAAGKLIEREVILDHSHHSWKSLRGTSLVLAPRLASRHRMNLEGKPTVKLANASEAGIPALATPDEAVVTLWGDVETLPTDQWSDPERLSQAMLAALKRGPSAVKFSAYQWLDRVQEIIG